MEEDSDDERFMHDASDRLQVIRVSLANEGELDIRVAPAFDYLSDDTDELPRFQAIQESSFSQSWNNGLAIVEDDIAPANVENFDIDLPVEHSYLGNTSRVSGVQFLEANKTYRILLFTNTSIVYPGEILPMILAHDYFDTEDTVQREEGLLFGVVFPSVWRESKPLLYGVTCQVYEKSTETNDVLIVKSRALQRFVVTGKDNPNFTEFLSSAHRKSYGNVKILPEIFLPDPLSSLNIGSLNRFRGIDSMSEKLRRVQAATTVWPNYIYKPYNINSIIEQAKLFLASYKIESLPTDPVMMSFWLARNLPFSAKEKSHLFMTDSVNIRMRMIEKSFDQEKFFSCIQCRQRIANCSSSFAMSKHGVQSNYCNPAGYIHELNTVYDIFRTAVYPNGKQSDEFSWFPGYAWQMIVCKHCDIHLGWRFTAKKSNMIPKIFYGLSGNTVIVTKPADGEYEDWNTIFRIRRS